jgi:hypothetical protein
MSGVFMYVMVADCIRILVKCIPLDNIELDESLHTLFGIASQFDEKKDSAVI